MIAYLVTNTVNGKQYVGISKGMTPDRRWKLHLAQAQSGVNGTRKPYLLHQAIAKHGAAAFVVEHIASSTSWTSLCELERQLIKQCGTFWFAGRGYNMTHGGDGVDAPRTEEWIAKIAKAQIGRAVSAETCAKMRAARQGISIGSEHRAKISAALKGRPKSAEHVNRVAAAQRGVRRRPLSAEHKSKVIAVALLGRVWITDGTTNHRVDPLAAMPDGWHRGLTVKPGRKCSPEGSAKLSAARTGCVRGPHTNETKEKMRGAALRREEKKRMAA